MGSWGEGLLASDNAQEAVDLLVSNVQELKRPITDRVTLLKVIDETLEELNVGNKPTTAEIANDLSVEVLAIAEHLRLHGVTLYPILKKYVAPALEAELKNAKTWANPRKRRGVLQSFAMKVGL